MRAAAPWLLTLSLATVPALARAQPAASAETRALAACRKLHQAGQLVRAVPVLKRLASSKNTGIRQEASYLLGQACRAAGRTEQAERVWRALAAERSPLWTRGSNRALGDLYRETQQVEKALAAYSRVIQHGLKDTIDADVVCAAEAMGDLQAAQGKTKEAIEAYQYALVLAKQMYEEDRKGVDLAGIRRKLAPLSRARRVAEKGEARVLFEEAERLRKAEKFAAALDKYREVTQRFPESAEAHPSGLHVGTCLVALGKHPLAEKQWRAFVAKSPEGPYRGHAFVGLTDILLEYHLNPKGALEALARYFKGVETGYATWSQVRADAYFRRAAVAYINGDKEGTIVALQAAEQYRPAHPEYARVGAPTPIRTLISMLHRGKVLTPLKLRTGGSGKARAAIVLGDLYYLAHEFEKALALFSRLNTKPVRIKAVDLKAQAGARHSKREGSRERYDLLNVYRALANPRGRRAKPKLQATKLQRAYARFREALIHARSLNFEEALGSYGQFLGSYAGTPLASKALLRAGTLCSRLRPNGPILAEMVYEHILKRYPTSNEAPSASYFLAIRAYAAKRYEQAIERLNDTVRRFPRTKRKASITQAYIRKRMAHPQDWWKH